MRHKALVFLWGQRRLDAKPSVVDECTNEAPNFNVVTLEPMANITEGQSFGFRRPLGILGSDPQSVDYFLQCVTHSLILQPARL